MFHVERRLDVTVAPYVDTLSYVMPGGSCTSTCPPLTVSVNPRIVDVPAPTDVPFMVTAPCTIVISSPSASMAMPTFVLAPGQPAVAGQWNVCTSRPGRQASRKTPSPCRSHRQLPPAWSKLTMCGSPQLRQVIGVGTGDAEGDALGDVVGDTLGDSVAGDALGDALGGVSGDGGGEGGVDGGADGGGDGGADGGTDGGVMVGDVVGEVVGDVVGDSVGDVVGDALGAAVGGTDGEPLGVTDGDVLGDALGVAVGALVGEALGDALGAAVGDTVGTHSSDQSYGHAVLAESESSIARLLQLLSAGVVSNMPMLLGSTSAAPMVVTLAVSKASGWLYLTATLNIAPAAASELSAQNTQANELGNSDVFAHANSLC